MGQEGARRGFGMMLRCLRKSRSADPGILACLSPHPALGSHGIVLTATLPDPPCTRVLLGFVVSCLIPTLWFSSASSLPSFHQVPLALRGPAARSQNKSRELEKRKVERQWLQRGSVYTPPHPTCISAARHSRLGPHPGPSCPDSSSFFRLAAEELAAATPEDVLFFAGLGRQPCDHRDGAVDVPLSPGRPGVGIWAAPPGKQDPRPRAWSVVA